MTDVAFRRDGKALISASADKTLKIWDATTGQETRELKGHTAALTSVAWSPDNRFVVSASQDKTLRFWNPKDGSLLLQRTLSSTPLQVRIHPKAAWLGVVLANGTLQFYDLKTFQKVKELRSTQLPLLSLGWSASGRFLVTGDWDAQMTLYRCP